MKKLCFGIGDEVYHLHTVTEKSGERRVQIERSRVWRIDVRQDEVLYWVPSTIAGTTPLKESELYSTLEELEADLSWMAPTVWGEADA